MLRKAFSDPLTRLGALGALLLLSVVLVHLPATIYAGNVDEFDFALSIYLLLGVPLVLALALVAALILHRLPRTTRALAAGFTCGLALVAWVYGNFLLGDTVLLDGRHTDFDFGTPLGGFEPLAAAAVAAGIGFLAVRQVRSATIFLVALNVGLAAATLSEALRDTHLSNPLDREDTAPLFRFSRQGNVLLVLLDTLQADVFDRVVRADPVLPAGLDGFTLYRDTAGVAPTTLLSIPAIHSGERYPTWQSIRQFYEQGVRTHSFLNDLAAAGFESTLLNPVKDVCPRRAKLCTSTAQALDERGEELRDDALLLLDLSLFRVAPFNVKHLVYRGNKWLFSRLTTAHFFSDFILQGNDFITLLGDRLVAGDGPRTAKFIHLFTTHPPYILAADCTSILPNDIGNVDNQALCSLHALLALFESMKQHSVYDTTAIAVIADHGYALPSTYADPRERSGDRWSALMGAANPTFAFKPPNAHGRMGYNDTPVALTDVAASLCAAVDQPCPGLGGHPVTMGQSPSPRQFFWYEWEHEWWKRDRLPPDSLVRFDIDGPLSQRSSWHLAEARRIQPYHLGSTLDFHTEGARPLLPPYEWSRTERTGTWTEGDHAEVSLRLSPQPPGDLQLIADVHAFLDERAPLQRVKVLANGSEVAAWVFRDDQRLAPLTAIIPHALLGAAVLTLRFELPDAVSPSSLGREHDPRTLGIALRSLRLVAAPD